VKSPNPRVMSLVDPQKKMSKSEGEDKSRINLTDTKDKIIAKIKKAVTDSEGGRISYEPEERKGLSNLMRIYGSLKNRTPS
jgi:tryptophanyl-tRNA synthetase